MESLVCSRDCYLEKGLGKIAHSSRGTIRRQVKNKAKTFMALYDILESMGREGKSQAAVSRRKSICQDGSKKREIKKTISP